MVEPRSSIRRMVVVNPIKAMHSIFDLQARVGVLEKALDEAVEALHTIAADTDKPHAPQTPAEGLAWRVKYAHEEANRLDVHRAA